MPKPVKRAKSFIGQYAGDFRYAREIEFFRLTIPNLSGNLAKSGMTKK